MRGNLVLLVLLLGVGPIYGQDVWAIKPKPAEVWAIKPKPAKPAVPTVLPAPAVKSCSCSNQCTCGCNAGQACQCGNAAPVAAGVSVMPQVQRSYSQPMLMGGSQWSWWLTVVHLVPVWHSGGGNMLAIFCEVFACLVRWKWAIEEWKASVESEAN